MAQKAEPRKENIFKLGESFSSFSVHDAATALDFYKNKLGIEVKEENEGLALKLGPQTTFLYTKKDHSPASFTVLNFPVADIDWAVDELSARGIKFESYGGDIRTDEKGIFRGGAQNNGPNIAWFKDPA